MTIQPLPEPSPSWAAPIAFGALATFAVHVITLAIPELWILACCACGLSGAPVGFLPAFLAMRRDPLMGPMQCFAVSFIATGIGTLAVAFLLMVVMGWVPPPEWSEEARHSLEESGQIAGSEPLTPEEIDEFVAAAEQVFGIMPLLASGVVIVMGGLTGLITGLLMGRRAPPPRPA